MGEARVERPRMIDHMAFGVDQHDRRGIGLPDARGVYIPGTHGNHGHMNPRFIEQFGKVQQGLPVGARVALAASPSSYPCRQISLPLTPTAPCAGVA